MNCSESFGGRRFADLKKKRKKKKTKQNKTKKKQITDLEPKKDLHQVYSVILVSKIKKQTQSHS